MCAESLIMNVNAYARRQDVLTRFMCFRSVHMRDSSAFYRHFLHMTCKEIKKYKSFTFGGNGFLLFQNRNSSLASLTAIMQVAHTEYSVRLCRHLLDYTVLFSFIASWLFFHLKLVLRFVSMVLIQFAGKMSSFFSLLHDLIWKRLPF